MSVQNIALIPSADFDTFDRIAEEEKSGDHQSDSSPGNHEYL